MSKVRIAEQPPAPTSGPSIPGVRLKGGIVSREVIAGSEFPLSMWRHTLTSPATIRVDGADEDHVFYVLDGALTVGGARIGPGGVMSVGRRGAAEIKGRGELLHYLGDAETRPDRPGGCVHILAQGWTEHTEVTSHTLYLDSSCPCCSVWLHRTRSDPGRFVAPHHHTEDEIICVAEGAMDLGARSIATGGAVGVGRETVYSFTSGAQGLTFVNFRQADPFYVPKEKPRPAPASERGLLRDLLGRLATQRVERERASAP